MTKRVKAGQKKHDEAVLRSVKWYEGRGYKINADLPDYNKPKNIGGYVPDLIAKKDKKEIILEVETKNTNELDKEQQEAFKEYSERGKGRIFKKKLI